MRFMPTPVIYLAFLLASCGPEKTPVAIEASSPTPAVAPLPRRENGMIDYARLYEAHCSQGVTKENNAATLLVPFLGHPFYLGEDNFKQVCDKLEIVADEDDRFVHLGEVLFAAWEAGADEPKLSPRAARIVSLLPAGLPAEYRRRFKDQEAFAKEYYHNPPMPPPGPWSAQDSPIFDVMVRANERQLDQFRQAVRKERLYLPRIHPPDQPFMISGITPSSAMYREAVKLVLTRAMHRVHLGDHDGAWDDVMSCYRLVTLVRQTPSALAMLGAAGADAMTHETAQRLATEGGWPGPRLMQCLAGLLTIERGDVLPAVMEGEEYFTMMDQVAWFRHVIETSELPDHARRTIIESTDWDQVTSDQKRRSDEFTRTVSSERYTDRNEARKAHNDRIVERIRAWESESMEIYKRHGIDPKAQALDKMGLLEKFWHFWSRLPEDERRNVMTRDISAFVSPGAFHSDTMVRPQELSRTKMDLTRVTFALCAYRAERGRFPDLLADLVPHYLSDIPPDRFTGKPLIYKVRPDGFLLYSLGSNLKDDGGGHTTDDEDAFADVVVLVKDGKFIEQVYGLRANGEIRYQGSKGRE